MNETELKFYNYLIKNMNVNSEDIKFNSCKSPDFIVKTNGGESIGYEVKLTKWKTIHIHNNQHIQIKELEPTKTFIAIMNKEEDSPLTMIPYDKIMEKSTQKIDGYKIYLSSLKKSYIFARKEIVDLWKRLVISNRRESQYERLNKLLVKDCKKMDKEFEKSVGFSLIEHWKKDADWHGKEYKEKLNEIFANKNDIGKKNES